MNSSINKGLQRIEDIFGADFSNREIAKIIKPAGDADAILELKLSDNLDSDRAGELTIKLRELLNFAPLFTKAAGESEYNGYSYAIWLEFDDLSGGGFAKYVLAGRISELCVYLDPDRDPKEIPSVDRLEEKYNIKILK